MLLLLGAAFALSFQGSQQPPTPRSKRLPAVRDSANDGRGPQDKKGPRTQGRDGASSELATSAFKDPTAKVTLLKARSARLTQDSALVAYDAMSHSADLGRDGTLGRIGTATRFFFSEHEAAARDSMADATSASGWT